MNSSYITKEKRFRGLYKTIFIFFHLYLTFISINCQENDHNNPKSIETFNIKDKKEINSLKFLHLKAEPENFQKNLNKESSLNQKSSNSQIRYYRLLQSTPNASLSNTTQTTNKTNNSSTSSNQSLNTPQTILLKPKCFNDLDCSNNGICDNKTNICFCKSPYISYFDNKTAKITKDNSTNITYYDYTSQSMCNYQQKKQLTAFMLSIFVGFGAEHFYLERTGIAIAKLVFYIFCGFLNVLYLILYKCVPGGEKYVSFIHTYEALYLGCGVGYMLLWNIYDWVNIGFNSIPDGNNVLLSPWGL